MSDTDHIETRRSRIVVLAEPRRRRTRNVVSLRQRLKTWNTIPDFLRDNEYIRTGYRANWSVKEAFLSLFQLHNETLNVWTHLFGFLIFVVLMVHVWMRPPASLVHPRESLEHFWSSVQDKMQYFGDHIGDNVHSLHDTFHLRIGVLHDSMHESLSTIQSQLHENLEHARDSFQLTMEPFANRLHKSRLSSAMSDVLHHFQGHMGSGDGSIPNKIATVRSNLEKSFISVQECLHNAQHDLSGNLGAARTRLRKSISALQDSLAGLQMLLMDTNSRETQTLLNQTSDQCPNTSPSSYMNISLRSVRDGVVRWPVFLFMSGAMFCLLVSSICHLFACCSMHASRYMWRFDYTGISVLIVTSFYPAVYYSFFCESHWVAFYLTMTTVLGLGTVVASLVSHMQHPKFRPLRAGMFSALGLFGVIPWCHQLFINFHEPTVHKVVLLELAMAAFYLGGAAFFVLRIPERFKPGAFDIVCHSHQIFHIFVVIAACIHYQAVMLLMEWRESTDGCPSIPLI